MNAKQNNGWNYVYGQEGSDRFVLSSPCGKFLLIGEYESREGGVRRTIRLVTMKNTKI